MIDYYDWIRHIAITAHYCAHDDRCVCLLAEGLITDYDAQNIRRYIRDTLAPAGSGHAAVEHITVGRKAVNREVQLQLDFSL